MSECQYYDFAALDRPLTRTEMAELRAVSSRAVITPASFTNHYEWGDLKADPANWTQRYFDAFIHTASWCACRLSLRLPKAAFRKAELQPFANRSTLSVQPGDAHWILNWTLDESEDYDRFAGDDGSGWMRRLIPLRDDALEPEVPPGLTDLSPAQQALTEFLEVDPDLLDAARAASAAASPDKDDDARRLDLWLSTWQGDEMKAVLERIALGQGQEAERQVKSHYAAWLKVQPPSSPAASIRRRVADLRELTGSAAAMRREREAKARAKQEASRRRQREARLRRLMAEPDTHWKAAEAHAARGVASGYEQAVHMLVDLAEAYALVSSREAFDRKLRRFLVPHARRTALLRRLADAGLLAG